MCVPWLIDGCVMTHWYMCRDWFVCVPWLIHMCDMTHSYVWHDYVYAMTHSHKWVMAHIRMCALTHLCVWHDSFIRVKGTNNKITSDNAHSYEWHVSIMCVTWPDQDEWVMRLVHECVTWLIHYREGVIHAWRDSYIACMSAWHNSYIQCVMSHASFMSVWHDSHITCKKSYVRDVTHTLNVWVRDVTNILHVYMSHASCMSAWHESWITWKV